MVVLMYAIGNIITAHYVHGLLDSFFGDVSFINTSRLVAYMLQSMGNSGYSLNIFVDLLLCSLVFFFLNYKPKKIFTEKKIIYFRLLVLLPILYEVVGILVKYYLLLGIATPSTLYFFLLPGKPFFVFIAFLFICLFLKFGEIKYIKKHGDAAILDEHKKTNAHALNVSINICIIFVIAVLLDVILSIVFSVVYCESTFDVVNEQTLLASVSFMNGIGFTGSVVLVLAIPFVLLFSYAKTHNNKNVDKLIPVIGVALIVFVYIEGVFRVLTVNISNIVKKISDLIDRIAGNEEGTDNPNPLIYIARQIRDYFNH